MKLSHALNAGLIAAPDNPIDERRLRAYFANMLRAVEVGHTQVDACRKRVEETLGLLPVIAAPGPLTWEACYSALMTAIEAASDSDFYQVRDPVDDDLDLRAVTFQIADRSTLRIWLDGPANALSLVKAVRTGTTRAGQTVGRPRRAVWLTPLKGPVADLIDRARDKHGSNLAKEVRDSLANSAWKAGSMVVAFITRGTIRNLGFLAAARERAEIAIGPVGPTVVEAGVHKHFRHWPRQRAATDRYGRTYHFDPRVRGAAVPAGAYGMPEAVRSPIPLSQFGDCVVIGRLSAGACQIKEPDEAFLQAIDATEPPLNLLQDLLVKL